MANYGEPHSDILDECEYIDDEFMRSILGSGPAESTQPKVVNTDLQRSLNRASAANSRHRKRTELANLRLRCQQLERANEYLRLQCCLNTQPSIGNPMKVALPWVARLHWNSYEGSAATAMGSATAAVVVKTKY